MARSRTRAERSNSKQIRLRHQRALERELGIYHTLEQRGDRIVELAEQEPIAQGYPKYSQTAKVMQFLELWGAENARL